MSFLSNKSLENLIQYSTLKNKAISENIANIGSKNYQRKDVNFKEILADNMNSNLRTTNSKHVAGTPNLSEGEKFEIVADKSEDKVSGINNVDIDKEMSELAENSLRYKFATRKMGLYYKNLQSVITGGK